MNTSQIPNQYLEKLTLSKENIMKLLYDCRVTEKTTSPIKFSFYSKDSKRTAPKIDFDLEKLAEYTPYIRYLFNQIYPVHNKQTKFSPGEGIIDFSGKKWTDDNRALFALYYLATGAGLISPFKDGEKSAYTKLDSHFIPTYPANHPKFNLKDAKLALKEIGFTLPDGQSHVD